MQRSRLRLTQFTIALALILFGLFMPREWYDAVPQSADVAPPPVKGVSLLQALFVLDGFALLLLLRGQLRFDRIPGTQRLTTERASSTEDPVGKHAAAICLSMITAFGLILRVFRLDSDLWLDEIAPLLTYGDMSVMQVLASYVGSNNHLLNTLLVNGAVALFGREEWAIRLPAVLFGTATIPAFYWVARLVMSRTASLSSALLLCVAYHHIFFSQNSRGYAAYLFFAVASSGLLYRALRDDDVRTWCLYLLALLLGISSLLNSMFVIAAHLLVCSAVVCVQWRLHGGPPTALMSRVVSIFIAVGILALHVYALALPHAYVYLKTVYAEPATGYRLLSAEFMSETLRGLATAVSSAGWIALPVLFAGAIVGTLGFLRLARANWVLLGSLVMPSVLTAAFIALGGLTASPRFFLSMLFPAILCAVAGVEFLLARWPVLARRPVVASRTMALAMLAAAATALIPLRHYYATPKQPYRATLRFIQEVRRPGDIVVAVHLAEQGFRYYGPTYGLDDGNTYYVRSTDSLNQAIAANPGGRVYVVTTLHRILGIAYPDLAAQVHRSFQVVKEFPATIGDGQITVWRLK